MTKRIIVDASVEHESIEELVMVEIAMVGTMLIEVVIEKENNCSKTRVTLYLYRQRQDFLFLVPVSRPPKLLQL